jgi:hypothetical protein
MTQPQLDDAQVVNDERPVSHLYSNLDIWWGEYPIYSMCGLVTKHEQPTYNPDSTKCPICIDLDEGQTP